MIRISEQKAEVLHGLAMKKVEKIEEENEALGKLI